MIFKAIILMVAALGSIEKPKTIVLNGESLKELVASGKYNTVDERILEGNLPFDKISGEYEVRVIKANQVLSTDQIKLNLAKYSKEGWQLAQTPHLLAFGAKYPNEQRTGNIVALGTSLINGLGITESPYLDGDKSYRTFGFQWVNGQGIWSPQSRFLIVRKIPKNLG